MKVLMFGWEFPPHISGGLGTACFGLTQGLVHHNTEVIFVLPRVLEGQHQSHVRLVGANRFRAHLTREEFAAFRKRVRTLAVDSPLQPYLTEKAYRQLLEESNGIHRRLTREMEIDADLKGGYGPGLMSEIIRYSMVAGLLAATEEFDVIHCHDWMTAPAGIEARRVSGKPLVVHAHALEFDRSGENINREVYEIERAGLQAADLVIAVSHYTKNRIVERYGIPASKIRVVHNAVSREKRFQQLHLKRVLPEKVVLFLGRVTFQKGPDYFVEAARIVLKQLQKVRFVMAGSGDMWPRMVERVAELRLGDRFHFTGFLRGAEVERIYALSDLYVMPSVSEPFGITPLEAMVYNVPIIVSRQSGVAEILDHAVKVDFWDVEKLAASIIRLLTREEETRRLVKLNSLQLRELKWELAAEKVLKVYQEVLALHRERSAT